MNVSIWYDGELQETQYFKYRDGYSASGDDYSNYFRKVLSISVNDETWEVKVVAQANAQYSPKTIKFQIEKTKQKDLFTESKKEEFKWTYETAKQELLATHTRNATTALRYNMAFRWDLTSIQDPYQQVPYEKAKIISHAIDYKSWLAAVVLSAQIDASARSGRQMEYVVYIIHIDGKKEQVRRETIYAEAIRAGKSVKIPNANDLIKEKTKQNQ